MYRLQTYLGPPIKAHTGRAHANPPWTRDPSWPMN